MEFSEIKDKFNTDVTKEHLEDIKKMIINSNCSDACSDIFCKRCLFDNIKDEIDCLNTLKYIDNIPNYKEQTINLIDELLKTK